MKKTILATLLMFAVNQAYALDADQVTRAKLLESDRLEQIQKSSVVDATQEKVTQLKQQLTTLKDGDNVVIPAGKYPNLGQVVITANDVTIKAEKAGTAWMTGLIQIDVKGDNVTLDGLVFTEGGPHERHGGVRLMGDNNTLQNSTFYYFNDDYTYEPDEKRQEYPKYLWITLWGTNGKVINNRFEGKLKRGTLMGVQTNETGDDHTIKHNIFVDMKPNNYNEFSIEDAIRYNANTWEAVRIGDSKSSIYPSRTQFVENLMIDMDGEQELLAIKSGENIISGNTIFSSAGLISLRHGKGSNVENNVILGDHDALTGGIRIYDTDHVVKNNYIAGTRGRGGEVKGNADVRGAIVINTGIIDVINNEKLSQETKGKELNKQWTPQNVEISNNSIIDAQWGIIHGSQVHRVSLYNNDEVSGIYAGDKIHFSNNLVSTSEDSQVAVRASSDYPLTNSTYKNEVYAGQLIEAEQLKNYTATVPELKKQSGFTAAEQQGADVSKLKVITADVAGPSYVLK